MCLWEECHRNDNDLDWTWWTHEGMVTRPFSYVHSLFAAISLLMAIFRTYRVSQYGLEWNLRRRSLPKGLKVNLVCCCFGVPRYCTHLSCYFNGWHSNAFMWRRRRAQREWTLQIEGEFAARSSELSGGKLTINVKSDEIPFISCPPRCVILNVGDADVVRGNFA